MEEGALQYQREVALPCQHDCLRLRSVVVGEEDLLAMSCGMCGDIKLINMENGKTHVAYKSEKKPGAMCLGDDGFVWVHCMSDHTVAELNCRNGTFLRQEEL